MIILDTNVISELMHAEPDPSIIRWLDLQPPQSIWTTSITLMELRSGLLTMPEGKRRARMALELEAVLKEEIEERYALFDNPAAEETAILLAGRKRRGRPMEIRDTLIAGIVISRHATLATRNIAHFSDLGSSVVDPWNA